ncbi:hypothetical protein FGAF437_25080 [Escherichia coli]|nr:hypothetical protein FGAF437_25080 [Escherichia coli]
MTEIVADKTVEVVKNAIETADGALDLYNKYLDQVIPWQTFDETIKELSRFKQEYSQAASVLVGDIKTLLMDSQDKYFEATQTVYEWCGVATQLLAAGSDSNLLIVFYVQIMPDDLVMQLHRF